MPAIPHGGSKVGATVREQAIFDPFIYFARAKIGVTLFGQNYFRLTGLASWGTIQNHSNPV